MSKEMKRNQREEVKKQYKMEDKEMQKAIMASMNSYIDEKDKDEHIIDTLDKIGFFRQMTHENNRSDMVDWEMYEEMSTKDDKIML